MTFFNIKRANSPILVDLLKSKGKIINKKSILIYWSEWKSHIAETFFAWKLYVFYGVLYVSN